MTPDFISDEDFGKIESQNIPDFIPDDPIVQTESQPEKDSAGDYLTKKVQQGALRTMSGGAILAGGLAATFGAEKAGDRLFKASQEMIKAAEDVDLGVGTDDSKQSGGMKLAGAVASAIPQIAGFVANIPAGVAMSILPSISDAGENIEEGLSRTVVATNLATDIVANTLGALIPGGFGKTVLEKVGSGVGANVTLGVTTDAYKNKLTATENTTLAEKYDPTNMEARTVDVLFGAFAGASYRPKKPSQLSVKEILQDLDPQSKEVSTDVGLPTEINDKLGGVGKKGFRQGGAINLNIEPMSIETKAKKLGLEEWSGEFLKEYPQYAERPEIIAQVYSRLSNPDTKAKSLVDRLSDSSFSKDLDTAIGIVSTRVKNISEPVLHRMIRYEMGLLQKSHQKINLVDEFLTGINELPKEQLKIINNLLLNNNTKAINDMLIQSGHPELRQKYSQVRQVLDDVGVELASVNKLNNFRKDYFPRIVKDLEGLKTYLGSEKAAGLDARIREARLKAFKKGQPFGIVEESQITNSYLQGYGAKGHKPGFSKERRIDEVTPDLEPFYATPTEGLHTYLRNATSEIETAKFFGKDAVKDAETGRINVDESIGELVAKQLREGKISGEQAAELESLIRSRFGPGNDTAPGWQQDAKNIINMGLLGNVISSITQGGDVIVSAYLNDMRPTMMALAAQATNRKRVSMKDFGLIDHISEEFVGQRATANALNKIFRWSGFTSIDAIGKNTILNGALLNAEKAVSTEKGLVKFAEKWQNRFGDDFPELVNDLQNGRRTELTDLLIFSQLSKIQPITKLEVPQAYLNMPKGRVVYMLKTFMLKQMDLMRNDALQKMRSGNFKEGLGNLMRYSIIMGMGGASTQYVKDFLMYGSEGADFELSDIPLNILKTFGWSEYVSDKAKTGKIGEALGDIALPPYKIFDVLFSDAIKELDGDEDTESSQKSLRYLPIVGRLLYTWFTEGGQEYSEKIRDKQYEEEEE